MSPGLECAPLDLPALDFSPAVIGSLARQRVYGSAGPAGTAQHGPVSSTGELQ